MIFLGMQSRAPGRLLIAVGLTTISIACFQPAWPTALFAQAEAGQVAIGASNQSIALPRTWTFQGLTRNASLGFTVASARDVNGDGFPDIVVGAPGLSDERGRMGGILLFTGSENGLGSDPTSSILGMWKNSRFGETARGVGDVDGDGFGDLLMGVPRSANARSNEVAVLVYAGSKSGINSNSARMMRFRCALPLLDPKASVAGDVNRDGYEDVLINAPFVPAEGQHRGGAAWLLCGSKTGLVEQAVWTPHEGTNSHFGGFAAGVADVNGDGFADVAVGAPMFTAENENVGRVCLYFGSRNGLSQQPNWIRLGSEAYERFGGAVAGLGDINHDGFPDIAISASGRARARPQKGKVFLFCGSRDGMRKNPDWISDEESASPAFGRFIAGAGDVNGDGFADLLVSDTEGGRTATNEGCVYLYLGSTNGLQPRPGLIVDGGSSHARFGGALAGAGDVNRDGLDDFLIGSPQIRNGQVTMAGRVDLFYGSREAYREPLHLVVRGNTFAPFVDPASNSDTLPSTNSAPVLGIATIPRTSSRPELWPWVLSAIMLAACGACVAWLWRHRAFALKQERARIARDLHDDLGARLTRLSMIGGAANSEDKRADGAHSQSVAVAEDARMAMAAIREIVWRVDPANDSLEKLAAFLGQKAHEMFEGTAVRCFTDLPLTLPQRTVSAKARQHVFFAVREALTNVLRHAGAKSVWVRVQFNSALNILIEDDGRGLSMDPSQSRGNGLRNMRFRMEELGGTFAIEQRTEGGARVSLRVKV